MAHSHIQTVSLTPTNEACKRICSKCVIHILLWLGNCKPLHHADRSPSFKQGCLFPPPLFIQIDTSNGGSLFKIVFHDVFPSGVTSYKKLCSAVMFLSHCFICSVLRVSGTQITEQCSWITEVEVLKTGISILPSVFRWKAFPAGLSTPKPISL